MKSNERDKNMPLHLEFMRIIQTCVFSVVIFDNFQRNLASRSALSIRFLRFDDVWRTKEHSITEKVLSGCFLWGGIWG